MNSTIGKLFYDVSLLWNLTPQVRSSEFCFNVYMYNLKILIHIAYGNNPFFQSLSIVKQVITANSISMGYKVNRRDIAELTMLLLWVPIWYAERYFPMDPQTITSNHIKIWLERRYSPVYERIQLVVTKVNMPTH